MVKCWAEPSIIVLEPKIDCWLTGDERAGTSHASIYQWSLGSVCHHDGLYRLFNVVSVPAIQAFVGFRFADRRGELFNIIYVANNIGVAVGTGLSGVLADLSYQLSFVMNGVTSAVFAGFFWSYLSRVDREEGEVQLSKSVKKREEIPARLLFRDTRLYLFVG